MNVELIDVHPRDCGFGKLRYTERLFADVKDKTEAFLGRLVGLYDYSTEFDTDIIHLFARPPRRRHRHFRRFPRPLPDGR